MKKNLQWIICIAVLIMMVMCLTAFQTADEAAPNPDTAETPTLNPMTGLPVSNPDLLRLPPVIVPLARYPSAFRPSTGHSLAQWVFEMYVSDEESRPMLMFYGELPNAQISRISSAIHGLESLRRQYGGIIISGGVSRSILESDIRNMEIWYGPNGSQVYPVLPVADYQRILNKWVKTATPADPNNLTYAFDETPPEGGVPAKSFFFRYASTNHILWRYDEAAGKYMRFQNTVEDPKTMLADVDQSNGEQIGADNLIILMAIHDWAPDIPHQYGVCEINLNYVTSLPAVIMRDGKLYNVTWTTQSEKFEKDSGRNRPIRFMDENGNYFRLKPGKSWVHIVMPGNPYYEVDEEMGSELKSGSGYWKLPYISFKPGAKEEVESEVKELNHFIYFLNMDNTKK